MLHELCMINDLTLVVSSENLLWIKAFVWYVYEYGSGTMAD